MFGFIIGFICICIAAVAAYYNSAIVTYVFAITGMVFLTPFLQLVNEEIAIRLQRYADGLNKRKRGELD